jgi:hypothetical protein
VNGVMVLLVALTAISVLAVAVDARHPHRRR